MDPKSTRRSERTDYVFNANDSFWLPNADHVFLPGHRVMVQIQSSWFPLYDRNPQTFVPNIFFAKPEDYVKATQRVYRGGDKGSFIELPVVTGP